MEFLMRQKRTQGRGESVQRRESVAARVAHAVLVIMSSEHFLHHLTPNFHG